MRTPLKLDRLSQTWIRWKTCWMQILAILSADLQKLKHDPYELFTRMVQPAIWLLLFGQAMANAKAIPVGNRSYLDFIAPGILAQSVLFISIFHGISIIWEKDLGILQKILVSPTPRFALIIGKALASGVRSLSQIILIYFLCYMLEIHVKWDLFNFFGIMAIVLIESRIFSTFSLIVASIVKKRERFMGIGQVLAMPLFFASNALYPIDMMPTWLQKLSLVNPLTYEVDALRSLMIKGEVSHFGIGFDFLVCLVTLGILLWIATRLYPKILY